MAKCLLMRGVHLREVSVSGDSTVAQIFHCSATQCKLKQVGLSIVFLKISAHKTAQDLKSNL